MGTAINLKKHIQGRKVKKASKGLNPEGVAAMRKMLDEYRIHYQAALLKVIQFGGRELLNPTELKMYELFKNEQ